jgi:hypothetical protein
MQQTGTIIQFVTGSTEPSNQWTVHHTQAIVRLNDGRGSLVPYELHHLQTFCSEEDQRVAFSKNSEHPNIYDPKSLVECVEHSVEMAKEKFCEGVQTDDDGDIAPNYITIDFPDDIIPTCIEIEGCEYRVCKVGPDQSDVTYERY